MNVFGSHCNRPTHRSRLPIRPVLELVGLWPYRDRRPAGFSFSMKQRLALVIALVNDPEFLILDEPFVDLDPDGVLQLIAVLNDSGLPTAASPCSLQLQELCERFLFIKGGRACGRKRVFHGGVMPAMYPASPLPLSQSPFYSPAAATDNARDFALRRW